MRIYLVLGLATFLCLTEEARYVDQTVTRLPRIVAHRGFAGRFPENTLRAFTESVPYSHMFEFDVWFSKDNHMVIAHDNSLLKIAGVPGDIRDRTLDEIKALTIEKTLKDVLFREKIPTLSEVMSSLRDTPIAFNIEIKSQPEDNSTQPNLAKSVLDLVDTMNCSKRVLISSFDHSCVQEIETLDFSIPCRLLLGSGPHLTHRILIRGVRHVVDYVRDFGNVDGVTIDKLYLTPRLLHALQQSGFRVGVWSIDTIEEMKKYCAWGVDDMVTKNPDVLHEYLTTHHHMKPLGRA